MTNQQPGASAVACLERHLFVQKVLKWARKHPHRRELLAEVERLKRERA